MRRALLVRPVFILFALAVYVTPFPFLFSLAHLLHQWPIPTVLLQILYNMDNNIVIAAMCVYGIARASIYHPFSNQDHLAWLRSTPWTPRTPLPLGPLQIVWQDLIIMVLAIALTSWTHLFNPILPVATFVLAFSLKLLITNVTIEADKNFIQGEPFAVIAALPLLAIYWQLPWMWYVVPFAVYLLEQSHLRKTLHAIPWIPRAKMPTTPVDWPWSRIGPAKIRNLVTWRKMVSFSILIAWWIFAFIYTVAVNSQDPVPRSLLAAMLIAGGGIAALLRAAAYCGNRPWPIGIMGRLFTGNLILPRYDIVFIGPLCVAICTAIFACLLRPSFAVASTEDFLIFAAGIGSIVFVAFIAPPSWRRWTLTGGYRLQPPSRRQRANTMHFQRKHPFLRHIGSNSSPL